jgi:hypothetical protein
LEQHDEVFFSEMSLKYCGGSARLTETVFGWGRNNVELGLAEKRTGITCVGAHSASGGAKRWEERQPEAAAALLQLAEAHAQQDSTFQTTIAYTRLTAAQAIEQLYQQGFNKEQVPARAHNGSNLESNGLSLATGGQSQTSKKIPQTNAIFDNIQANDRQANSEHVKRLSIDCKATVMIGEYARGGKTRGDRQACDYDFGSKEKYIRAWDC